MAVCKSLVTPYHCHGAERHNWPARLYRYEGAALDMAKKYAVLRLKFPKPEGGFLEAFEIGLADLSCWGDQYFDASGYPYPDEVHAFVHDWLNLSRDFEAAMRKVGKSPRRDSARVTGAADNAKRPQEGERTAPAAPRK